MPSKQARGGYDIRLVEVAEYYTSPSIKEQQAHKELLVKSALMRYNNVASPDRGSIHKQYSSQGKLSNIRKVYNSAVV